MIPTTWCPPWTRASASCSSCCSLSAEGRATGAFKLRLFGQGDLSLRVQVVRILNPTLPTLVGSCLGALLFLLGGSFSARKLYFLSVDGCSRPATGQNRAPFCCGRSGSRRDRAHLLPVRLCLQKAEYGRKHQVVHSGVLRLTASI